MIAVMSLSALSFLEMPPMDLYMLKSRSWPNHPALPVPLQQPPFDEDDDDDDGDDDPS